MSPQKGPNVGQVMGYAKISMNIRLELKDSYYPPTYSHFVCQIEFIVDLLVDIDPKTYIIQPSSLPLTLMSRSITSRS